MVPVVIVTLPTSTELPSTSSPPTVIWLSDSSRGSSAAQNWAVSPLTVTSSGVSSGSVSGVAAQSKVRLSSPSSLSQVVSWACLLYTSRCV